MSVLVAGGAGYIGSHTVRELVKSGEDVVVADSLVTGHRQAVDPKAHFYEGDVRDKAFLDRVFSNEPDITGVIHFAAFSLVGESMSDPLKYYDNNLGGAISLLEAMTRHGVSSIVFSSSAAVYGEPERVPILETDAVSPTNAYGETKLAMEGLFKWLSRAAGLRYVSLRYFNACGADAAGDIGEAHSPETHLIPIILQAALGQRDCLTVFGDDYPTPDGTCIRDYIHVSDLAAAHVLALRYLRGGGASEIFNLGCGSGFSVLEMLEASRRITGSPIPARIAPRRSGDPARLVASSEKAARILGWRPRLSDPETVIASAWKWHSAHPNGYGGSD